MRNNQFHIDQTRIARPGIKLVEADIFERGEFRSANLRDAIVAARREAKA
jgi:hypothetical protein